MDLLCVGGADRAGHGHRDTPILCGSNGAPACPLYCRLRMVLYHLHHRARPG